MGSKDPGLQDPHPQIHQPIDTKEPSRGKEEIAMNRFRTFGPADSGEENPAFDNAGPTGIMGDTQAGALGAKRNVESAWDVVSQHTGSSDTLTGPAQAEFEGAYNYFTHNLGHAVANGMDPLEAIVRLYEQYQIDFNRPMTSADALGQLAGVATVLQASSQGGEV